MERSPLNHLEGDLQDDSFIYGWDNIDNPRIIRTPSLNRKVVLEAIRSRERCILIVLNFYPYPEFFCTSPTSSGFLSSCVMLLALPTSPGKVRPVSHSVCISQGPVRRHKEGSRHARELLEELCVKNKGKEAEVGRESQYVAVWVCERMKEVLVQ